MAEVRGVLWDIDGTLLDSNDAHARAFCDAFAQVGRPLPFVQVRRCIGMGSDHLIPALIDVRADSAIGKRISELKKRIFFERYFAEVKPFAAARELVLAIRAQGLLQALATSASGDEREIFLRRIGIERYVDFVSSKDDVSSSKPSPEIVDAALGGLGLEPEEAILVGDTPYDLEAAQRAGVKMIAFRSGGWSDADLAGSVSIFDGPWDMLRKIDRLAKIA